MALQIVFLSLSLRYVFNLTTLLELVLVVCVHIDTTKYDIFNDQYKYDLNQLYFSR